jgi:hypothetical protein
MSSTQGLDQIPPALWVVIGVILVFTVIMDVLALMDLYRRPGETVSGGKKWIWLLIILFVNSGLGAIVYFLIGRKPAPAVEAVPERPATERAEAAMDALYGGSDKEEKQ